MRRRHKAGFALASAVLHACGHQPVAIRTTGTTSASSPSTTEATTTTAAPATTALPTSAPAVTAPPSPPSTAGAEPTPPTTVRRTTTTEAAEVASGACGGALPPCSVMRRESGGDPTAVNATGCGGRGCYGKWQFDPRTSQGLGYALTMDQYPESVQDAAAATLWAGGAGCSHWGACAA